MVNLKEKYLRPSVTNAAKLEGEGFYPALALLGGFVAGKGATKLMEARPSIKLPGLKKFGRKKHDI